MTARLKPEQIAAARAVELPRIVRETLALEKAGKLLVARCPFHAERTPSFTVFANHFHCFGCNAHGNVVDWLMSARGMTFPQAIAYLGYGGSGEEVAPDPPQKDRSPEDRKIHIARKIWNEAALPEGTLVATYLASRGLSLPGEPVIRFHPACPCGELKLPAMIALMSDPVKGEPRGIHRTFLQPDGGRKADIDKPKMMLGPAGVIRLYEPETDGLGIAEGIETALAVAQRIGWGPVWSVGSKCGIRTFPPLIARTLNIFVDNDDPDATPAAEQCAERWLAADLEVRIHTPPTGTDWADATGGFAS
jgi:DNA primase